MPDPDASGSRGELSHKIFRAGDVVALNKKQWESFKDKFEWTDRDVAVAKEPGEDAENPSRNDPNENNAVPDADHQPQPKTTQEASPVHQPNQQAGVDPTDQRANDGSIRDRTGS